MKYQMALIVNNGILLLLAGIGLIVFFFWQRAEWMDQTLQAPASEHG